MLLKVIFLVLGLLFFTFSLAVWQVSYESVLTWVAHSYPFDEAQWKKLTSQILNPQNFRYVQIFSTFGGLLLALISFWIQRKVLQLQSFLERLKQDFLLKVSSFCYSLQKMNKIQKITIVIFLLVSILYNSFLLNFKIIHIDEAFSYVHFASKGFWVSALYYPNPNNHILLNLWVSLWEDFFGNKLWAIRLPSMLCLLFLQILLFRFFLKRNSFQVALALVLIFTLLSPIQAYSVSGRGYLLLTLWVWLSGNALLQILEKVPQNKRAVWEKISFFLASIAGFYTIPLFLYYFAGFLLSFAGIVLLQFKSYKNLIFKNLMLPVSSIFVAVFFLYLPILLLNGSENLLATSWQNEAGKQFRESFWSYWQDFGDFWLGIEGAYAVFLLLLLLGFAVFLKSSSQTSLQTKFWLLLMISALILMILQQKLLPQRTWIAMAIPLVFVLENFLIRIPKFYQNLSLAFTISALISLQVYQVRTYPQIHSAYVDCFQKIRTLRLKANEKIFSNDLIYQNLIAFYNLQEKWGVQVDYSNKNKNYDWVILDKSLDVPLNLANYQKVQETAWVEIWKYQK
ncbi:hypothetical protein [Raineya sp.]|jgi:hypothetical protein